MSFHETHFEVLESRILPLLQDGDRAVMPLRIGEEAAVFCATESPAISELSATFYGSVLSQTRNDKVIIEVSFPRHNIVTHFAKRLFRRNVNLALVSIRPGVSPYYSPSDTDQVLD